MANPLDDADQSLRDIISSLYHLLVQVNEYQGAGTSAAMIEETKQLISSLNRLSRNQVQDHVPVDLISFVEQSRNPQIYDRQFSEEAMRLNQELAGKSKAFLQFSDILAREMCSAVPATKPQVEAIIKATTGEAYSAS